MKFKYLPRHNMFDNVVLEVPDDLVREHDLPCSKMCVATVWCLGVWLMKPGNSGGRMWPVTPFNPQEILEWEVCCD